MQVEYVNWTAHKLYCLFLIQDSPLNATKIVNKTNICDPAN
jgi:hypothetical protein